MEQRRLPEHVIEVFADPTCIKDVVRGKQRIALKSCHNVDILMNKRRASYNLLSSLLPIYPAIHRRDTRLHLPTGHRS